MTISLSNNVARQSYAVAAGVTQSSFTVSFAFFDAADLNVYVDDVQKTLTTEYTVTGGDGSTGSVNISVTGATGGSTVVITRDIDLKRTTDFPSSGPFAVATLNTELDKLVAISADLDDRVSRSIILSDFDSVSSLALPSESSRANKYLAFDANGEISLTSGTADVTPIGAAMEPVVGAVSLEVGRENLFPTLSGSGTDGQAIIADGTGNYNWEKPQGVKNIVINGAMTIAQRGLTVGSLTSVTNDEVKAGPDRFRMSLFSAGTWGTGRSTVSPDHFTYSKSMECITARTGSLSMSARCYISYYIEGQDVQQLKKGTSDAEEVTVSFHVRSPQTGTHICELVDSNGRRVSKPYVIATADTWQYVSLTFPADTDSSGTLDDDNTFELYIVWWLVAGGNYTTGSLKNVWNSTGNSHRAVGQTDLSTSTGTFYLTGVQMEVGSSASPFQYQTYAETLRDCQRYFCKSGDVGDDEWYPGSVTNQTIGYRIAQALGTDQDKAPVHVEFPVTMVDSPTVAFYSATTGTTDSNRISPYNDTSTALSVSSFPSASTTNIYGILSGISTDHPAYSFQFTAEADDGGSLA